MKQLWIILVLLAIASCEGSRSFDRRLWDAKDKLDIEELASTPFRKDMVQDILDYQLRLGMHYRDVKDLLGDVDCWTKIDGESIVLNYGIEVEWGNDVDPVNKYWLEITFSPDSLLTDAEYKDLQHDKALSGLSN